MAGVDPGAWRCGSRRLMAPQFRGFGDWWHHQASRVLAEDAAIGHSGFWKAVTSLVTENSWRRDPTSCGEPRGGWHSGCGEAWKMVTPLAPGKLWRR